MGKYIKILIIGLIISGLGSFGIFMYTKNKNTESRITSLENQLSALVDVFRESSIVSQENKQRLSEFMNRSNLIAKSQDELLTSAVAKTAPAVVSIVISKDVPLLEVQYVNPFGDDPFFRGFGIQVPTYRQVGTEKRQVGAGTGFLIRSDGYIITNQHVVSDTEAEYVALLTTGEQKQARVIYRDDNYDMAILKIDGSGYSPLPLGDSASLKLGQTVVAIGNALGEYNNSVSVGIISGLDRPIQAHDSAGRVETIKGAIQTDAAINPGNSGGPLVDLTGVVVGVNVAVERGANNIAFAIPINDARRVLNRILP